MLKSVLIGLGCTSVIMTHAHAQVSTFYQTTPLTILVGLPSGGAYDIAARSVARHLGKHVPGNPKVVVQNMPGAGGLTVVNYLYNRARRDGSQIALFQRGIAVQPLYDKVGVQFDATKLGWIGSVSSEVSVFLSWHSTSIETFEDARQRELIVPLSGPSADSTIFAKSLNSFLGTKLKFVSGYPGNAEMMLAMERGEVEGNTAMSLSTLRGVKANWLAENKVRMLLQLGLKKHPDLSDVPLVLDMASTQEDRQALELLMSRQDMAYPIAGPPGLPPERLAALRDGFNSMVASAEFAEDLKKQGYDGAPLSGTEIESLIQKLYASPASVVARVREALATQ